MKKLELVVNSRVDSGEMAVPLLLLLVLVLMLLLLLLLLPMLLLGVLGEVGVVMRGLGGARGLELPPLL